MKKVLVIEDNPNNMYLMSFILRNNEFEVIEANTGEKGIEPAVEENPDLILLDIQLPRIDGIETVKRIREIKSCKIIPIISITSFAMAGDKERLLKDGCNGYIEKPINPETLIGEIMEHL